jgi:hypothetical protein
MTSRDYRKMLTEGRKACHLVETLMSQNQWDQIAFDHLPSRAGLLYKNAFMRREETKERYAEFMSRKDAKVNASVLNPVEIAHQILSTWRTPSATERQAWQKYWDNLKDYFNGATLNAMVVCDTSSSMLHGASGTATPMQVAVSLAMYAAERANGPFKNHYISFSHQARLVEVIGADFCGKVSRIIRSNVCENTNLESVFDLVLNTAMQYHLPHNAMPKTLVVVSDMEVDRSAGISSRKETFMESMRRKWAQKCGNRYEFPNVVFWNVSARNDTFLDDPKSGITFVSGCSPVLFEQIMSGKTSFDLMMDKLNAERYKAIH